MKMQAETITPERAEALLLGAAGIPQRAITTRRVNVFASAMQRGQWRITHQAIALDTDGVLIDGQHRLSAVVLAGVPVEMMVAYDVPRDTFDVLDTGTARTTASTLHIAGVPDANAAAAAARMMLTYDQIGGTRKTPHSDIRSAATSTDVLSFMSSERGDTLRGALGVGRSLSQSFSKYGMRSWMSAAIALIDETHPDASVRNEFFDKMHSGAMLSNASPVLTFRRWIGSDTGYGRSDRAYRGLIGLAGMVKTWNAFVLGNDLSLIRHVPGRQIWPLPGRDLELEAENERLARIAETDRQRAEKAAADDAADASDAA